MASVKPCSGWYRYTAEPLSRSFDACRTATYMGHLTDHQAGPLWQPMGCDVGLSAGGPNAPNILRREISAQSPPTAKTHVL